MKKIQKYEIRITNKSSALIPVGAKIISAKNLFGFLYLFAIIDIDEIQKEERWFHIADDIHELPNVGSFIDSVNFSNIILHIFELEK